MGKAAILNKVKIHLSKFLERVKIQERLLIGMAGKAVAALSSGSEAPVNRIPGMDAGKIVIADDFDAPLPEFDP